jgi:hypothetical protein
MLTRIVRRGRHVAVLISFALMLAASFAVGCDGLAHPKDLPSVSVQLKRTACDGTCLIYTVAIHGSGLLEYLPRPVELARLVGHLDKVAWGIERKFKAR